jgi:hypothetical protein
LRLAQRPFHPRRFVEGALRLRGQGVRVLLDVMIGLPGDALADVRRSLDFAAGRALCDDLKAYPLCVLPGTVFRRRARELGIEHQREPPYHVLRTPTMSSEEICDALDFAEDAFGEDLFPIEIPRASDLVISPRRAIASPAPEHLGQTFCIEIRDPRWAERLPEIRRAVAPALKTNPYSLIDWILPPLPLPSRRSLLQLQRLAPRAPHVVDRDWFATHNPTRSTQFFLRFPEAMVRLPSPAPDAAPRQRACWISFTRRLSESAQERFVDRLEEAFAKDPDVWFRVGGRS